MKIKYIICDIETVFYENKHRPTVIGGLSEKELIIFRKKNLLSKFLMYVYKSDYNYIYSHNFSNYDSYFFLKMIILLKLKINSVFIKNNSVFFLEVQINDKIIYFRDSYLLFPDKLKNIT